MTSRTGRPRGSRATSAAAPASPGRAHCANCGITVDEEEEHELSGAGGSLATDLGPGAAFCCDGCADGGPCTC